MCNILLACDNEYYHKWTVNLIKSIQHYAPELKITTVVVNPEIINELPNVHYVYDKVEFPNEECKVAYYQAVRFLKCYDIFPNKELVMSVDCDSICRKNINNTELTMICSTVHVLKHPLKDRFLAGMVTFGNNNKFRKKFKEMLLSKPLEQWTYGWDQEVLSNLNKEFKYDHLDNTWMSIGKVADGTFYTLKGSQKDKPNFVGRYEKILEDIKDGKTIRR